MSTWESMTAPTLPAPYHYSPNRAIDFMDIDFFSRSETDLAINIRKATSIGQSWHYAYLELELELELEVD